MTIKSARPSPPSPAILLAALVCAGSAALWVYQALDAKPTYSDLIVGNLAWRDSAKLRDFALPISGIGVFSMLYLALSWLSRKVFDRCGLGAQRGFHSVLLYALLPSSLAIALLFFNDSRDRSLFATSALLTVVASLLCGRMARRRWRLASPARTVDVLGSLVVSVPLGAASAVGLVVTSERIPGLGGPGLSDWLWPSVWLGVGATMLAAIAVTSGTRDGDPVDPPMRRLRLALLASQATVPLLFTSMVPPRPASGDAWWSGEVLSPAFWLLLGALVLAAYLDLAWRVRRTVSPVPTRLSSAISPMCLLAVVMFVAENPSPIPTLLKDDYHWGEMLVPFWSWYEFGRTPFVDYTPARGLINYLPGLVASIFGDGTAASFTTTAPVVQLCYHALVLFVFTRVCGRGIGFLIAVLLPVTGAAEMQLAAAGVLAMLTVIAVRRSPATWLVWWVGSGTALVLFAPGEGGLLVLATMPLGAFQAVRSIRSDPLRLGKVVAVSAAVAAVIGLATPVGVMLLGAVRYGLEQSSVNTVAHGRPWSDSAELVGIPWAAGPWRMPMPYGLWEFLRAGFPVVASLCFVVAWDGLRRRRGPRRALVVAFGASALLYLTLLSFRSLGRIDVGSPSRTVMATLFGTAVALPVLVRFAASPSRRSLMLVGLSPFAFLVALASGAKLSSPSVMPWRVKIVQPTAPVVDGHSIGAPNLGRVSIARERLEEIVSLGAALSQELGEGAGYLDLTNRSAMHFFLDRPPGLRDPSAYNTVHRDQQLRTVRAAHRSGVEAALADPVRSLPWDGGGPSLRSNLLWRYVVRRFEPRLIDGWCVFTPPNPMNSDQPPMSSSERRAVLSEVFPVQHLGRLPIAWGRSAGTLEGDAFQIVQEAPARSTAGVEPFEEADGIGRVTDTHIEVEIDLGPAGLDGHRAGLLILDLDVPAGHELGVSVEWTHRDRDDYRRPGHGRLQCLVRGGTNIIPLDASADWVLGRLERVRIRLDSGAIVGSRFGVRAARLAQRTGAEEVDRLASEPALGGSPAPTPPPPTMGRASQPPEAPSTSTEP